MTSLDIEMVQVGDVLACGNMYAICTNKNIREEKIFFLFHDGSSGQYGLDGWRKTSLNLSDELESLLKKLRDDIQECPGVEDVD